MIVHGNTLISTDLLDKKFVCDLHKCKGACCVEGEGGAPLELEETKILKDIYPVVASYLSEKGRAAIRELGTSVTDPDKEYTGYATPLIGNTGACAYVNWDEKGIAYCGIEKAWLDKKIDFRKPVSCHLYPVRVKVSAGITLVNYEEWDICDPACALGEKLGVPVYKFVREALIRRLGEETMEVLEAVANRPKEI